MRPLGLGLLVLLIGCDTAPVLNAPPTEREATLTLGGLKSTHPYFGRARSADSLDHELQDSGDFMLAFCGCDCWRAMISRDDGAVRTQFLVHFSRRVESESTAEATVLGGADGSTLSGTVNQDTGLAEGRVLIGPYAMVFAADRSEQQADKVKTCAMCHVGEDPPWPLPAQHPQYQADPPTCLSCHPVD